MCTRSNLWHNQIYGYAGIILQSERERVLKGVWCTFITRDERYMSNAYDRTEIPLPYPLISPPFPYPCIQSKQL
jgi:hypothetical protein